MKTLTDDEFEELNSRSDAWIAVWGGLSKITPERRGRTGVEMAINIINKLNQENTEFLHQIEKLEKIKQASLKLGDVVYGLFYDMSLDHSIDIGDNENKIRKAYTELSNITNEEQ